MFDVRFPAILSGIGSHFKFCQYVNYIGFSLKYNSNVSHETPDMVVTGAVLVEDLEGRSQVLLGVVVARVAHHHRQELRELDHPAP